MTGHQLAEQSPADARFRARLTDHDLRVAVVGLGFAGLPVAHAIAAAGHQVVGIDIAEQRVAEIAAGTSPVPDVTDANLAAVATRLTVTTDAAAVRDTDVVIICVPTPLTAAGEPDLSAVDAATESLGAAVTAGTLVILQSTVPPGTTERVARLIGERSGLTVGEDLFVAFAPERIDPANRAGWTVANTPRVVGGVTARCADRAAAVVDRLCGHAHRVSGTVAAELSKLLENTYRLVNIALANEFADVCADLGVSAREVIAAAASKPFGFQPYLPGPGVGGECIPVDPVFLLRDPRRQAVPMPLVETARRRTAARPLHVAEVAADVLARAGVPLPAATVLVLGVAYKADVDDIRNAPALGVITDLLRRGATVHYCDPFVPEIVVDGRQLKSVRVHPAVVAGYDCAVLVTDHDELLRTVDWSAAPRVLDTRGVLPSAPHIIGL